MRISEIVEIVQGKIVSFHQDYEIETLDTDSRKPSLDVRSLFFALDGFQRDGHDFISQAYQKGVRSFIVSKTVDALPEANFIKVENVLVALQQLGKARRENYDVPVVGITGSNGKTIVKEWLATVIGQRYRVTKSPKSYNSQIGVPLSVWTLNAESEIGVFEAGISQSGEMASLERVIQPTIGIITNIGEAHDAGFSSREAKLKEKLQLFRNCEKVVYCQDQRMIHHHVDPDSAVGWSLKDQTAPIYFAKNEAGFSCAFNSGIYQFKTKLTQVHDVENILHVISICLLFGLSEDDINNGLDLLKPVAMRLQLKTGVGQIYLVDDSYNNDLAGLKVALEYLQQQPFKSRKSIVLSDIQQSGKDLGSLYEEVNRLLVSHRINRLIGVGSEISSSATVFEIEKHFFPTTQHLIRNMPSFSDELVLIKGARGFEFEKIVAILEEKSHGTVLEVNMEALTHNLNVFKSKLRPETKLMVMVKAFAYGGGLNEVAHLLQFHKVDYLGVAYLDEGIQLRRNGIHLPIMVMNPERDHLSMLSEFDLQPEIYSLSILDKYLEDVRNPQSVHLKIESGMNRLGFTEDDVPTLLSRIRNSGLRIAGIFTHFSSSDNPKYDSFTEMQAGKFDRIYDTICAELDYKPLKHAINSSGIARWPKFQYDMVRLGIGLYGYDSSNTSLNLKTVSTLKATVSQVKSVKKGHSIGYNRMGTARSDGQIAILSIGYADGYLRVFSNGNAFVQINGKRAPTIGNVCMDMIMVDVTGLDVCEGDEAVVFGKDPTIVQLADWAGTIPYEILTNIGQRVKRVFVSE